MAFRASRARGSGLLLSTACSSSGYLVMRWWGLMSKSPSVCLPERLCFSHHCGEGRGAQACAGTLLPAHPGTASAHVTWLCTRTPPASMSHGTPPARKCGTKGSCLAAPGHKPWSASLAGSTGRTDGSAGQTGGTDTGQGAGSHE